MITKQRKGIIFITLSALMFGTYGMWSRLIGNSFGAFYQGWTRAFIISIVLLPILLWNKQIISIPRKDWGWLSLFLFFTSLTQAPVFYAFNHMDIGSATLLFFVSMLLTMYMVGILFLGEKLTKIKALSFLLASVGMYVIFSFSLVFFSLLAALLAIVNGIASGGEVSFSKKLSGNYSPLYICWLSWVIILITNTFISLLIGEIQHSPSFSIVWLYQIGYTTVSLLGFWLIIKGLKYTEASTGGLIGLFEIVISILLGVIIFKEKLNIKIVFGAIFIIVAAALPHIYNLFQKTKQHSRRA